MLNFSEPPLDLRPRGASDRLLQPLWDHLLLHHRPLISSPFFPVVLAFSSYSFFSLPFAAFDLLGERLPFFYKYKIQSGRQPTLRMMVKSFMTALWNHLFFVLPVVIIGIFVLPAPVLPSQAPQLHQLFTEGLGVLLVFDAQYYVWHLMHHRHTQLYRWVHAIHHEYAAPFSWSTEHLSIPELLTVGFWANQDPVLLRCHPLSSWLVTVFSLWLSVENHIGYDLPWALNRLVPLGLLGGAPAHDVHHQRPSSNFAPFFCHWDRLFGTAAPEKNFKTVPS